MKKSFVSTLMLCFFLGTFGAHRYYIEDKKIGNRFLIASLIGFITLFFGIGFLILFIVAIFQFIDLVAVLNRKAPFDNLD